MGLHAATEGTVRKLWYPEGAGLHMRHEGLVAFVRSFKKLDTNTRVWPVSTVWVLRCMLLPPWYGLLSRQWFNCCCRWTNALF